MAKLTEISGIEARRLYLAAKVAEAEHGKSIEELLIDLSYNADSDQAKLEAIRLYFAIMFNSGLGLEDLEIEAPNAQLISLAKGSKADKTGC
jgi:hypothetical protein